MVCKHLKMIEEAIQAANIEETFRGKAWSKNCREWVYFNCYLDIKRIRQEFDLDDCVEDFLHADIKTGYEAGLSCNQHHDAIMGIHPKFRKGQICFPPKLKRHWPSLFPFIKNNKTPTQ